MVRLYRQPGRKKKIDLNSDSFSIYFSSHRSSHSLDTRGIFLQNTLTEVCKEFRYMTSSSLINSGMNEVKKVKKNWPTSVIMQVITINETATLIIRFK